ncbi:MAG TPA: hexose kinase [Planctomycetota bacterium]|nr:hexose kinase [Planctomycetota bacterium]
MIVTVTLNTAIDRVLSAPGLRLGKTARATLVATVPAGKGVNVSRYLSALDVPSVACGFVGRRELRMYEESFRDTLVTSTLIEVSAPTRINTTLLSDAKSGETHIREEGFSVPAAMKLQLRELLFELSSAHGPFVFAGSLPPDFSPAEFTEIITGLKARDAVVVVDTSGTALQSALTAEADLITPNEEELGELVKEQTTSTSVIVESARLLLENVPEIAVKRGRKGGVLVTKEGSWSASAGLEDVEPQSTVGAGDAFLAGLLAAGERGDPADARLVAAVAAGCASVLTAAVGTLDRKDYDACLARVEVKEV